MSRILVLGGYGVFGGRIALRLAAEGYEIVVTGRSPTKAQAFCAGNASLIPLALDRADLTAALREQKPKLVVDASGPFQAMDYDVPRACIAAGIPYCDIADGRDFVCGVSALDAEAKGAGVAVISGGSSVPALSGAVVRELAQGMTRTRAIEIAISASNRATASPAVAAAILGQVGQPMKLWRGGRQFLAHGWQELRRMDFEVPDRRPIKGRLIALADVPDLTLLPERVPGQPATTFRAGTELAIQNIALWLASWPVRWGLISSLSRFDRLLQSMRTLTGSWGSDRSAMMVRLFGDVSGRLVERRWTLIADAGDGPEIPGLTIPLLVVRILTGKELPGARDAGLALSLADYESAFAGLSVRHVTRDIFAPPPLYRQIMGERFDSLPDAVRDMHDLWRDGGAEGEAEVTGAKNWVGRLVVRIMGFPPPGQMPVKVSFAQRNGVERWTRDFGGHSFSSRLRQKRGQLVECFGPLRFHFDLPSDTQGLTMAMRGWTCLGVPLPRILAPRSIAREWEEDGRFNFDVCISLPLVGRLVHYRGWLSSNARQAPSAMHLLTKQTTTTNAGVQLSGTTQ